MSWHRLLWKSKAPSVVVMGVPLLWLVSVVSTWSGERPSAGGNNCLACLQPGVRNRLVSGGWNYATYPHPSTVEPHRTITIADLKGPG